MPAATKEESFDMLWPLRPTPRLCARFLCDSHLYQGVVKGVRYVAMAVPDFRTVVPQISKHFELFSRSKCRGPFSQWAAESNANLYWTLQYAGASMNEVQYRGLAITGTSLQPALHVLYDMIKFESELFCYRGELGFRDDPGMGVASLWPVDRVLPEAYRTQPGQQPDPCNQVRRYYIERVATNGVDGWTNRAVPKFIRAGQNPVTRVAGDVRAELHNFFNQTKS